jgi:hypothetical protein
MSLTDEVTGGPGTLTVVSRPTTSFPTVDLHGECALLVGACRGGRVREAPHPVRATRLSGRTRGRELFAPPESSKAPDGHKETTGIRLSFLAILKASCFEDDLVASVMFDQRGSAARDDVVVVQRNGDPAPAVPRAGRRATRPGD